MTLYRLFRLGKRPPLPCRLTNSNAQNFAQEHTEDARHRFRQPNYRHKWPVKLSGRLLFHGSRKRFGAGRQFGKRVTDRLGHHGHLNPLRL